MNSLKHTNQSISEEFKTLREIGKLDYPDEFLEDQAVLASAWLSRIGHKWESLRVGAASWLGDERIKADFEKWQARQSQPKTIPMPPPKITNINQAFMLLHKELYAKYPNENFLSDQEFIITERHKHEVVKDAIALVRSWMFSPLCEEDWNSYKLSKIGTWS